MLIPASTIFLLRAEIFPEPFNFELLCPPWVELAIFRERTQAFFEVAADSKKVVANVELL